MRGVSAFQAFVLLIGVFLLFLVLPNLGTVIRAAEPGAGVRGTFTAERLNCVQHPGHTACSWQGGFRSDDGRLTRARVYMYGGSQGLAAGASIQARDVGRQGQVYRPAGSHEWILSALLTAAGVLLLLKGGLYTLGQLALSRVSRKPFGPPLEMAHAAGAGSEGSAPGPSAP